MPYEGGLDTLAALPQLKQVAISPGDIKGFSLEDPAIQRLHRERPDILIIVGRKTLGGAPDQKREGIDDGYAWGGRVTTHG